MLMKSPVIRASGHAGALRQTWRSTRRGSCSVMLLIVRLDATLLAGCSIQNGGETIAFLRGGML